MLVLLISAALAAPTDCLPCHGETHGQWSESRHARAATNPVFTASWEHWPNGWCLGCHAPSPDSQRARLGGLATPGVVHRLPAAEPGDAWSWGVHCETCHLDERGVLRSAGSPSEAATVAHDIAADPALTDGRLCAECHEFPFQLHTPRWPFAYGSTPAQETITEWKQSTAAAAGRGCVDCHFAEGHASPGAHTPELVRGALQFSVERRDELVHVEVRAPGAPHRIPTGDPFRRILIRACADEACTEVLAERTMRRRFEADATSWILALDTTVGPETPTEPAVTSFDLHAPGARFWRADYRFGDRRFEDRLPPEEVGFVVASGPLESP
ncbi:MAG: hypothetical protein EP330_01910 [Deltaproteobacteria bacterium]|nr:MAG: hypothetical protein EP330_01910 [Deltaproteobacteria bacterium]